MRPTSVAIAVAASFVCGAAAVASKEMAAGLGSSYTTHRFAGAGPDCYDATIEVKLRDGSLTWSLKELETSTGPGKFQGKIIEKRMTLLFGRDQCRIALQFGHADAFSIPN